MLRRRKQGHFFKTVDQNARVRTATHNTVGFFFQHGENGKVSSQSVCVFIPAVGRVTMPERGTRDGVRTPAVTVLQV